MQDIRIEGLGKFSGGLYGSITIDGMGECDGDIEAQNVKIDGSLKCKGAISADLIDCDGSAKFESNVIAKKLLVDGMLKSSQGTKLEAEEIECDGSIHFNGQISTDSLKANGFISAKEIVGDKVVIKSSSSRFLKKIIKISSHVELIEATIIELTGVEAQTVNGSDIIIGPNCEIENLDCSGSLSIHPNSVVKTITGNYVVK